MAYLINGDGFEPVTAQQDADLYAGLLGQPLTVLNIGQKMAASIIDANTVRIGDGEAVCQGRRIHNNPGMFDDFTIPNGAQGMTRYYIIGYHLYDDGAAQVAETFVQQVANATDTIPEAVLRDGAVETYVSFYRIKQTGFSLTDIEPLYSQTVAADEIATQTQDLIDTSLAPVISDVNTKITAPQLETYLQTKIPVAGYTMTVATIPAANNTDTVICTSIFPGSKGLFVGRVYVNFGATKPGSRYYAEILKNNSGGQACRFNLTAPAAGDAIIMLPYSTRNNCSYSDPYGNPQGDRLSVSVYQNTGASLSVGVTITGIMIYDEIY